MPSPAHLSTVDAAAIEAFVQRVRGDLKDNLLQLKLYGSKASGHDDPESDIDILVIVRDADWRLQDHVVDLASDVNLEHNVYISPHVVTEAELQHPVWRQSAFVQACAA